MSTSDWWEFGLLNATAGFAIALDAVTAVQVKYRALKAQRRLTHFVLAATGTHIVFPMIGFVGGWLAVSGRERALGLYLIVLVICVSGIYSLPGMGAQRSKALTWLGSSKWKVAGGSLFVAAGGWIYNQATAVYLLGTLLLVALLCEIIGEAKQSNDESDGKFWLLVMSVSYDALLSGPGKTVISQRYPDSLAWVSFVIVGLLVGVFTILSVAIRRRIEATQVRPHDPKRIRDRLILGIALELMLFSFFLCWSAGKAAEHAGLVPTWGPWHALPMGLAIALALLGVHWGAIERAQRAQAGGGLT